MAITLSESDTHLVGTPVYQYGSPAKAGKIITKIGREQYTVETHGQTYPMTGFMVEVKWVRGQEITKVPLTRLRNLNGLIAETERKLQTHLKTRDKVRKL